ncbi:MAG: LLM class flavin-dependent oxidoreductase [Candidatus Bathyarchaeia archaeon]|jgi:alkanesulfonate monooxygenase SsuD/methylene tetrahydromethanopterin reductase-like flavin-dependent oxidoreductase (luciferase family)
MNFDVAVWGERDPWQIIDAARKIDQSVERFWLPETIDLDSVSILGAIAARTSRLKLGAGILNIYTRSIPLIAMTAATLQLISRNRFSLGIGVSTNNILEKHGLFIHEPLLQLRHAIQNLRIAQLPSKEGPEFHLPFQTSFPIFVGTIGEAMSSLAGELADGLIFNCATPEYAKRLVDRVIQGVEKVGRNRHEIEIRTALIFSLDPGRDREFITRRLAYYGAAASYNQMFKLSGFTAESEQLSKAWTNKNSLDAQRAISDEMIYKLTSTPENLARIAQRYASIGISGIVLVPVNLSEAADYLAISRLKD